MLYHAPYLTTSITIMNDTETKTLTSVLSKGVSLRGVGAGPVHRYMAEVMIKGTNGKKITDCMRQCIVIVDGKSRPLGNMMRNHICFCHNSRHYLLHSYGYHKSWTFLSSPGGQHHVPALE